METTVEEDHRLEIKTSCGRLGRRQGSAAIEFAILRPLMIVMLMSMVVYGGWMWLAQSVQTLATESARVAVGGLDRAELAARATSAHCRAD